jgi:DNA-binding NarL/FixJ family response regulator
MRVLLAEDEVGYSDFIVEELQRTYGHEVVFAEQPTAAVRRLHAGGIDAVVTDLLFEPALQDFLERTVGRSNPLTAERLITSGLSVIRAAREAGAGVVVWTSGSQNRQLHVIFAYEDLAVRAFCSKRSAGRARNLHHALTAVVEGRDWIDVISAAALPPPGTFPLRQTILSTPASKRSIWRALAVGARSRTDVRQLTGFAPKNLVQPMHDDLRALMPNLQVGRWRFAARAKFNELQAFAVENSQFFLDNTVREMYP